MIIKYVFKCIMAVQILYFSWNFQTKHIFGSMKYLILGWVYTVWKVVPLETRDPDIWDWEYIWNQQNLDFKTKEKAHTRKHALVVYPVLDGSLVHVHIYVLFCYGPK